GAPTGATATPSSGDVFFSGTRAASGSTSLMFRASAGVRSWTVTSPTAFNVGASDRLTQYLLVNSCNPPREVLFIWSDGTSEVRYSYGEDVIDTTIAHQRIGPLPAGGAWTRLNVLAASAGAAGRAMRTVIFTLYDGEV